MATTVVFGSADDNYVQCQDTVYATARDGTGTLGIAHEAISTVLAGQLLTGGTYFCYEALMNFDTSWIGVESLLAATLSLWGIEARSIAVAAAVTTSVTPYTTASFIAGASLPSPQATLAASIVGWNDFAEVSLRDALDPNAITYLMIFAPDMRDGVAPTGTEYHQFSSTDQAGTSLDPRLTVYTPDVPAADVLDAYSVLHPPIRDN